MLSSQQMFDLGAHAASIVGNCTPRYVCPLCRASLLTYDSTVLTKEHVPPRALGGKELLLTCKLCNNEAGSKVQADHAERERQKSFWAGTGKDRINLEIETEHGIVRGEASSNGHHREFKIQKKRTAPAVLDTQLSGLENAKLHQLGKQFDWHKSRISGLRNAYLWVFAEFGYSMVMHSFYDWIRKDIQEGYSDNQKWAIHTIDPVSSSAQETFGRPVIIVASKPKGALIVADGEHGCLLPTPLCPDPYSDLRPDKADLTILKTYIPVPIQMKLKWDFLHSSSKNPIQQSAT